LSEGLWAAGQLLGSVTAASSTVTAATVPTTAVDPAGVTAAVDAGVGGIGRGWVDAGVGRIGRRRVDAGVGRLG
jgi:hypothetical protein